MLKKFFGESMKIWKIKMEKNLSGYLVKVKMILWNVDDLDKEYRI